MKIDRFDVKNGSLVKLIGGNLDYPFWDIDSKYAQRVLINHDGQETSLANSANDDWKVELCHENIGEAINLKITITRLSDTGNQRIRFVTGIDSLMMRYPDYLEKLTPNAAIVEDGFFWSNFASPSGKKLALCCDSTVAGWMVWYDLNKYDCMNRGDYRSGSHQMGTMVIDLFNQLDNLPPRIMKFQKTWEKGETRTWNFYFIPYQNDKKRNLAIAGFTRAPFIDLARSGDFEGGTACGTIYSPAGAELTCKYADDKFAVTPIETVDDVLISEIKFQIPDPNRHGVEIGFELTANNCKCTGSVAAILPFERYIMSGASFANRKPPRGTNTMEAAMPAFGWIAAEKINPAPTRRNSLYRFFEEEYFACSFSADGIPLAYPDRIQNQAFALDLCREMYYLDQNNIWLERGETLVRDLLARQGIDGGLYAHNGRQHYSSVIYPLRSMHEFAQALAHEDQLKNEIELCVERGMADLFRRQEDIGTEGAPCYEDGAIACTSLQLAYWAFTKQKSEYAQAAKKIIAGHECLEWFSPNSKTNGATVRFWETFWAIGWHNTLSTPHGWSAWTGEAYYFIYLATGDTDYLRKFLNNLSACLSLIDVRMSSVYFCFTPESYVYDTASKQWSGERYLDMALTDTIEEGGRETYEIIKLLTDFMLDKAYLYVEDNQIKAINAEIQIHNNDIEVMPGKNIKTIYRNVNIPDNFKIISSLSIIKHGYIHN